MPLLEPLPEVKNLSQKVFERVREAILSGELAPARGSSSAAWPRTSR